MMAESLHRKEFMVNQELIVQDRPDWQLFSLEAVL